jgi:hypothetical protein
MDMLQYGGGDIFEYRNPPAPPPEPPPTFHQFTDLATELQDLVLDYCSMKDILNLGTCNRNN